MKLLIVNALPREDAAAQTAIEELKKKCRTVRSFTHTKRKLSSAGWLPGSLSEPLL